MRMTNNINRSLGATPQDLGLPEKFSSWREGQESALLDVVECDQRFHAVAMPTGWGKSVFYVAAARMLGLRTCILTSTKALQDQLLDDFSSIGMVDIRGRANYECCLGGGYTCDDGRHARCPRTKSIECPYRHAYVTACNSRLVVTNYSYWIYQNLYGEGLGEFDLLVCDEAHAAPEEVCNAMAVTLTTREVYGLLRSEFPHTRSNMSIWSRWAIPLIASAQHGLEATKEAVNKTPQPPRKLIRELADWKQLVGKLETIATADTEWAIQDVKVGVSLTPLWPSAFAEKVLFRHVERVFLVSATIRPKTMELLGVRHEEASFREYPTVFDPAHSPVYFMQINRVRVNHDMTEEQRRLWLTWIDWIIRERADRKGIIHSVSYKARDYILANSQYRDIMITHETATATQQVRSFMAARPPLILVSPSVTTGWDFPHDLCRYQILTKCPWPNMADKVLVLRQQSDPEYAIYMMAQQVVQAFGRGNRADDDFCENFLTDWAFAQFASRKCSADIRELFPLEFWTLLKWMDNIPAAPSLAGLKTGAPQPECEVDLDDIPF